MGKEGIGVARGGRGKVEGEPGRRTEIQREARGKRIESVNKERRERASLGKTQRDGSVEAGKKREKRGHNNHRKMCVCLLYCSGPTYPSILLRRHGPEEEG